MGIETIKHDLSACTLCRDRFSQTQTAHEPRPVIWFEETAKILLAGQAPGLRVHNSGRPFHDASGDRLRHWMAIDEATFYDKSRIAIVPMAFCFPGYNSKRADLPPPTACARTWRTKVLSTLPRIRLTLLIGGYAQKWHLNTKSSVTDTVAAWRSHAPHVIPLPHPSWRNTAWIAKNNWFETELLPVLRSSVQEHLR